MKKSTLLNAVNELPDKFDLDELIERLLIIEKIEKGLEDVEAGRVVSHSEVKAEFRRKWPK